MYTMKVKMTGENFHSEFITFEALERLQFPPGYCSKKKTLPDEWQRKNLVRFLHVWFGFVLRGNKQFVVKLREDCFKKVRRKFSR